MEFSVQWVPAPAWYQVVFWGLMLFLVLWLFLKKPRKGPPALPPR